jgi:hypothetical protein
MRWWIGATVLLVCAAATVAHGSWQYRAETVRRAAARRGLWHH